LFVIIALLLFAGIIAVTQEAEILFTEQENESIQGREAQNAIEYISAGELSKEFPNWVKPVRWFRSNQGGISVEEASSSIIALRNEYALSIGFTRKKELPQNLISFYNDEYYIEVRTLYKNGNTIRRQWLFKERNGITRFNAVILEPSQTENEEQDNDENDSKVKRRAGFIEIFDNASYLLSEYNFFDDENTKTDYVYKNGILINTVFFILEDENYIENYSDFYKYNRSSFLRSIERIFYKDRKITLSDEPVIASFPRNIADAAIPGHLAGKKINSYPEFFGEVYIEKDNKIVYVTDERSRILSQTLYDDDNNVIWIIQNTWQNDRIIKTVKTENSTEYLAEFEYNSGGDRIIERNFKNGSLERLVRTEGKTEVEELYLNNIIVLRAVWEDGRKISETRTGIR
jgi:hypothetical protein